MKDKFSFVLNLLVILFVGIALAATLGKCTAPTPAPVTPTVVVELPTKTQPVPTSTCCWLPPTIFPRPTLTYTPVPTATTPPTATATNPRPATLEPKPTDNTTSATAKPDRPDYRDRRRLCYVATLGVRKLVPCRIIKWGK